MKKYSVLLVLLAFVACNSNSEEEKSSVPDLTVDQAASEGARIANASQGALANALMSKVQSEGFESAVSFCRVAALPLTDSLSVVYNANIRRTSFRYRNPNNEPDDLDKHVLTSFEEAAARGETPVGRVEETVEGLLRYYQPITVAPLCTNCHGMPGEDLTADLHAAILDEYPEDRAVGYKPGDFRGSWVIEFP